ncbi:NAD(P)H pyrophosphatase NUDT13, mitochondrial isoform X2 [Gouania willdenowi]|nr:nucleoside diphosphate-linked moiety X motif 13 isoform X2 [Gouania willdenowi]
MLVLCLTRRGCRRLSVTLCVCVCRSIMIRCVSLLSTRHPSLFCCHISDFASRMRLLNRLKEDDEACVSALQSGSIFLFHLLRPLVCPTEGGGLTPVRLSWTSLTSVLQRLSSDRSLLNESVLIGLSEQNQNQAQFCLDVGVLDPVAVEAECDGTFVDMRKAFFLLTGSAAPFVAKGQALLRWHQETKFCSSSGRPTQRNRAGSLRVCGSITYYPKMSPVVIVLVSDGKRCLLSRQMSFPPGLYSALAGFCDMGESLEESLRREVAEEVGLEVCRFSFSGSQHWPFPQSSFMIGCHAHVNPAHTELSVDWSELEDARWFSLEEIDHALQVQHPIRGEPQVMWFPPKHAIAHRLIREWVELQRAQSS